MSQETLIEKLAKTRDALLAKKEVGVERLEELKAETRRAFDEAIERWYRGRNIREELASRYGRLRLWRVGFFQTIFPVSFKYLVSMPFIYGMLVPAVFLHICLEVYHQVCFRLYGIPRVDPRDYFIIDRTKLPYLNWFEKINCFYCEYFNCLLQYTVEVAGRTERFWCPIKHARRVEAAHAHYTKFVDYLDGEHYHEQAKVLRDFSDITSCEEGECDFIKKKKQRQQK
jgi:hypothetical protein